MKDCKRCGGRGGHHAKRCDRNRPNYSGEKKTDLALARGWFARYSGDRTLISENGARFFAWLLAQFPAEDASALASPPASSTKK